MHKSRVGGLSLFGHNSIMKNIDLSALNNDINQFVNERDWEQFHSLKNLSMALTKESAELMEIFQWQTEKESNDIKNNPQKLEKVQDEIADVFMYLMRIVHKTDIDLEAVVRMKMQKNREKYPVELSKGNAKKYNEF
jgi:dCTP diphosphatase